MKLTILLTFCLIATALAVTPACVAANYCKGCSETVATTCTSCHNWKMGKIGAKYLATDKCLLSVTAIANCKIYSSGLTVASTLSTGACLMCDSGYTMVETTTTGPVITPTCVKTKPTACTLVANCSNTNCKTSDAGVTFTTPTCNSCDSGKGASTASACAGTIVANCDTALWNGTAQACHYPKSNYAVASTGLTTVAYTTDKNCQQLQSVTATNCENCWDGYYWNTTSCKLSAKVMVAGLLFLIGLFIN